MANIELTNATFSTREAADGYVLMNIPGLSINDVKENLVCSDAIIDKFKKKIAKSRFF